MPVYRYGPNRYIQIQDTDITRYSKKREAKQKPIQALKTFNYCTRKAKICGEKKKSDVIIVLYGT